MGAGPPPCAAAAPWGARPGWCRVVFAEARLQVPTCPAWPVGATLVCTQLSGTPQVEGGAGIPKCLQRTPCPGATPVLSREPLWEAASYSWDRGCHQRYPRGTPGSFVGPQA